MMIETKHARTQKQRRVVPNLIVDWLLDYGAREYGHHGGIVYYFDKRAKRQVERAAGRVIVSKLESFLNSYLVVAGGVVVTVGRRFKKINRH